MELSRYPRRLIIAAVTLLLGVSVFVFVSYHIARRAADQQVSALPVDVLFYRQHFILRHQNVGSTSTKPAWEVRYDEDLRISGHTYDVRVSLSGRVLGHNFGALLNNEGEIESP
jgi:hypothetical protein